MLNIRKLFCFLILGLAVFNTGAFAADSPNRLSGTVEISERQFAIIIGGSTGTGVLDYKGTKYPFKISGLSVGLNVGVSGSSAAGDVYNLDDISKFAGTFSKYESSATFGGGVGSILLQNENGVIMRLSSTTQGFQLNLSASGVAVELEK